LRYSSKQFCTFFLEPCWKFKVVMNNQGTLFKTWDKDSMLIKILKTNFSIA
jgi:hypothetical protein